MHFDLSTHCGSQVSRVELADRHKHASDMRAELDALLGDVRRRENVAQQGARDVEEMLRLFEVFDF